MAKLKLSVAARADLAAIRRYSIAEFGGEVADAYFRGFEKAFDLLSAHPFAGSPRPEIALDARSYTHRRHRILYRVVGDLVEIVRVLHHAQKWPEPN